MGLVLDDTPDFGDDVDLALVDLVTLVFGDTAEGGFVTDDVVALDEGDLTDEDDDLDAEVEGFFWNCFLRCIIRRR